MDWHTIHVHHHDENADPLLLDAVRPLFARLAGQVAAVSWTRHWRLGPHLRLNVLADEDVVTGVALPAAREVVGGWLRRHPSTRRLDPAALLPVHRRLAAAEREDGPLTPWRPDNSLHLGPYDRRVAVLGTEEMADLLADFYADTTPLSFAVVEHAPATRRLMVAFDLIVATAHALSTAGIQEAFVSLRSHAEAFLHGNPEHLRDGWDRHYRRHADTLGIRLAGVVTALDEDRDLVPFVRDWAAVLRRYRRRAEDLMDTGRFAMPGVDSARMAAVSPFHRSLVDGRAWAELAGSRAFALYRLAINYTYLQLTRLGVAPEHRFLLCHLAANTVEERGVRV
jgi:hypothetical protein